MNFHETQMHYHLYLCLAARFKCICSYTLGFSSYYILSLNFFKLYLWVFHWFCTSQYLELPHSLQALDPRKMQINLTGFLNAKNARAFMAKLWAHLVSASESDVGISEEIVQTKVREIEEEEVRSLISMCYIYLCSRAVICLFYTTDYFLFWFAAVWIGTFWITWRANKAEYAKDRLCFYSYVTL